MTRAVVLALLLASCGGVSEEPLGVARAGAGGGPGGAHAETGGEAGTARAGAGGAHDMDAGAGGAAGGTGNIGGTPDGGGGAAGHCRPTSNPDGNLSPICVFD